MYLPYDFPHLPRGCRQDPKMPQPVPAKTEAPRPSAATPAPATPEPTPEPVKRPAEEALEDGGRHWKKKQNIGW